MSSVKIELVKYVIVGTIAFLCDFAVFLALTRLAGIHYLIANAVGFCLGLTISYTCCIGWVFSHRALSSARLEFSIFLGISLFNLGLGEGILLLLVEYGQLPLAAAKILMTGLIFLVNFASKKFFLFRRRQS